MVTTLCTAFEIVDYRDRINRCHIYVTEATLTSGKRFHRHRGVLVAA